MKTLILMRHAKSDWADESLPDHDRPLNARGRRSAPLMARHMAAENAVPEIVLASSARRVQETLQMMMEVWKSEPSVAIEPEVLTEPELYLASVANIAQHVDTLHDTWNRALVVGHNPGMGAMVCGLAEQSYDFPTAAVAVFQSPTDSWRNALKKEAWELAAFWKPRDLE